jgi:thioredoxin 1
MNRIAKAGVVVGLLLAVGIVLVMKQTATPAAPAPSTEGEVSVSDPGGIPRLLELGSVSCIPCKMMAPILEELREQYGDKLEVGFIDIVANPVAGKAYHVRIMPTQIFFDASGKEVFRHEGFFPKDEILAKWRELGVDLGPDSAADPEGA